MIADSSCTPAGPQCPQGLPRRAKVDSNDVLYNERIRMKYREMSQL